MIASRREWIRRALTVAAARPRPRGGLHAAAADQGHVRARARIARRPWRRRSRACCAWERSIVGAPFRGRSFVFRESELKFETDYYHEFLVAPGANIGEATARALAAAKVFATVAPTGVVVDPDWFLDGFVDALYGDARKVDKPAAVLTITYFLRRGSGNAGVPIWSRTYERSVPFTSGSADAYTAALNTAFGDVLAELARDLSALTLSKP